MRRLSLSLLIVVVLASMGLGWALDRLFGNLDQDDTDALQVYREIGTALVRATPDTVGLQALARNWNEHSPIGMQLLEREALSLPAELKQRMNAGEPLVLQSEQDLVLYFEVPGTGSVLALVPPPEPDQANNLRLLFTLVFYAGIILLVLLWLYPLTRRLQALATTARAFGDGQLDQRLATHERSNLHGIETEFNRMAARIETLMEDNRLLTNAVSHDLRTPLARLRFGLDVLDGTDDGAERRRYLARLNSDLQEMERLVETLLEFARLQQRLCDQPVQAINLHELVEKCLEPMQIPVGVVLEWRPTAAGTPAVTGHEHYSRLLVNNLLTNACTHARSRVRVSTRVEPGRVWLIVADDGTGIPEAEQQSVLKPFTRGTNARNRKGFGIGLAIVNRITQAHGAALEISRSETLGGARVCTGFATRCR